jgi:hypothetical protein
MDALFHTGTKTLLRYSEFNKAGKSFFASDFGIQSWKQPLRKILGNRIAVCTVEVCCLVKQRALPLRKGAYEILNLGRSTKFSRRKWPRKIFVLLT